MTKQFNAPGYPTQYSSSLFCDYSVIAPERTRIRFLINNFGTERFGSSVYYLWVSYMLNFKFKQNISMF